MSLKKADIFCLVPTKLKPLIQLQLKKKLMLSCLCLQNLLTISFSSQFTCFKSPPTFSNKILKINNSQKGICWWFFFSLTQLTPFQSKSINLQQNTRILNWRQHNQNVMIVSMMQDFDKTYVLFEFNIKQNVHKLWNYLQEQNIANTWSSS